MGETDVTTAAIRQNFDALTGYLLITDSRAHILYASKGLEKSKGFLITEIRGKTPGQVWGKHMDTHFYKVMWETLYEKKLPFMGSVKNQTKDNHIRDEMIYVEPVLSLTGEIEYYIEIEPTFKNVSDKKRFEKDFMHGTRHHLIHSLFAWLAINENYAVHLEEELFALAQQNISGASFIDKIFITDQDKKQIEEESVIARAQANSEIYGTLYQRFREKIFRYFLHHISGNRDQAEDLTEETFSKAFQHFSHYRITHASYASYLLGAAHNILINYYRKNKTISLEKLPNLSFEESLSLMQKIEFALIWQKVKSLSPLEREVLILRYQNDLPIGRIALIIGKSENATKLMLSRAQRKLKKMST